MNLQRVEQQFHSRLKCDRGLQRRSLTKAKRLKVIAFLLDRKRYNFRPLSVYFLVWEMRTYPNFVSRIWRHRFPFRVL